MTENEGYEQNQESIEQLVDDVNQQQNQQEAEPENLNPFNWEEINYVTCQFFDLVLGFISTDQVAEFEFLQNFVRDNGKISQPDLKFIRIWYLKHPEQIREECNDIIYYLLMLIECVVCNGCRPGETSERTEQFAKDTWINAKNTNQKIVDIIIKLKDDKIEEIMDYFPYFPFSDWSYETNIYELFLHRN
ncbi:hypothetical protein M9Y10_014092 [Tritrichomonas musculus]|uniref:Uncharacterized protein n=1 Tax=Tritrichomonas musculus TaxID=1915356 RepID=A0ABR2KYJ3_9EUKA